MLQLFEENIYIFFCDASTAKKKPSYEGFNQHDE